MKKDSTKKFDPNGPGIRDHLFGLPYTPENSELVIVPIPWEATVTYHSGTSNGPEAILKASRQIDHGNKEIPKAWEFSLSMLPVSQKIKNESKRVRELIINYAKGKLTRKTEWVEDPVLTKINEACESLNVYVKSITQRLLNEGKIVGLLGGDHSTPLGFIRSLAERYPQFGILQIDAHADLRKGYEGFTYSHASIMYNALKLSAVEKLVQVGIRDYCDEELKLISQSKGRIVTFFDQDLKSAQFKGKNWDKICQEIVASLPQQVYISFDIDGLDPKLCPNTGTPVPGGVQFDEAIYLIRKIATSGREIIGFDLNEVAPGEDDWDANVGARVLHQLCQWTAVSNKKLKLNN